MFKTQEKGVRNQGASPCSVSEKRSYDGPVQNGRYTCGKNKEKKEVEKEKPRMSGEDLTEESGERRGGVGSQTFHDPRQRRKGKFPKEKGKKEGRERRNAFKRILPKPASFRGGKY